MENQDTINLLKECDAGTKMAVSSIEDVLDNIKDDNMKSLLEESKRHHGQLGNEIHSLLNEYGSQEKEPGMMAKSMSKLKTNMKMSMDESDKTIADLMIDGCNMGIKSLHKYLNQYTESNQKVKDICRKLVDIEEELGKKLRPYL